MQVVLVYLPTFRRNLRLKCALQPEIAKKFNKTSFLRVQGRSRSSILTNLKSPSPVLVTICSTSVSTATVFTLNEILAVNNHFLGGSCLWRLPVPASLNLGGCDLDCWNLCSMLKISHAGCLGLYSAISLQFSVEMCAASKNCEKFTKTFLGKGVKVVQGHRCW